MSKCTLLNIDQNEVVGACDEKCKFTANYEPTPLRMKIFNEQNIIIVSRQQTPSVTFNGVDYSIVEGIRIRKNLLHNYSNINVECELSIIHASPNSDLLFVIVPILKSNRATKTSGILKNIINIALTMETNKYQTFKDNYFNVQDFIPTSNLLYYNASLKKMNNRNVNVVTFRPNANVTIDSETLGKLNDILTKEDNYCFNKQMDVTSGLYSNNTYNKNTIMNSNVLVTFEPVKEEETKQKQEIKKLLKNELRDLNYDANLNTSMENGTIENADEIRNNMTKNMANCIAKSMTTINSQLDTKNTNIEGFTLECMFCDSPNNSQLQQITNYVVGFSLVGSMLYIGSKLFLKNE